MTVPVFVWLDTGLRLFEAEIPSDVLEEPEDNDASKSRARILGWMVTAEIAEAVHRVARENQSEKHRYEVLWSAAE